MRCLSTVAGGFGRGRFLYRARPPDVTLYSNTPRLTVLDMPDGFHSYLEVMFNIRSNGYWGYSSQSGQSGHFAFGTRADLVKLPTAVFGQGVIFGNISGAPNGNPVFPSSQLETWFNGFNDGSHQDNILFTGNGGATPMLYDQTDYRIRFISNIGVTKTIRYTVSSTLGVLLYDSGIVTDTNNYFDVNKNGIWVAHVFSVADIWTINFSNIVVLYS